MSINIINPIFETKIFAVVFFVLLLLSIKKAKEESFFSLEVTNQLKGFAILAIIFSHIGYTLSYDNFLFPLSVLAGVGVNLFLFLSGFGLTLSEMKNPLSILGFYRKRLIKLFIPLWIVITAFFLTDFFIVHKSYPVSEIIKSYFGFFPGAEPFINLDSPLWYFTIILFYYLIYPLIYIKKFPYLTPLLILIISYFILHFSLPVNLDTINIYKLHTIAFPLGMAFAFLIKKVRLDLPKIFKFLLFTACFLIFLYTAIYSGVGEDPKIEQSMSLITTISLITIFSLAKWRFRLFYFFGIYSYEIYLIHWPILSRYGIFYQFFPPALATIIEVFLISVLAILLQKGINKLKIG